MWEAPSFSVQIGPQKGCAEMKKSCLRPCTYTHIRSRSRRVSGCLRCLLLVMCTHPFAKEALTLHLARSEGHERYFGCNLMHCKVLALSHQHLIAEAPDRSPGAPRRNAARQILRSSAS